MIRLYINFFNIDHKVSLSVDQAHYLIRVMRLKTGDKICIFNEKMGEFEAHILIEKNKIFITPYILVRSAHIRTRDIWLVLSPIKPHLTHFIVEKATELDVTHIQFILTERTQYRDINLKKLRRIAIEAAEQCERLDIPCIFEIKTFEEFIETLPCIRWIAALEREKTQPLEPIRDESVGIIIGPEGGFSRQEKEFLGMSKKIEAVSLGKNILRTETAAICSLARLAF